MNVLASAFMLALVVKSVLDFIAEPLRTKFPQLDLWWFDWVALAFGGAAAWFANLNLFSDYFTNDLLGRILTAFVVGGGTKLLNEIFSNAGVGVTQSWSNLPSARGVGEYPAAATYDSTPARTKPRGW